VDSKNLNSICFSNYAIEVEDKIVLNFAQSDLKFMLNHLDWAQLRKDRHTLAQKFLSNFANYNGQSATTTYASAFIGVRSLLNLAIG
jgi:hypothetical protein